MCSSTTIQDSGDFAVTHLSRHKTPLDLLSCEVSVLCGSKFVQRMVLQCGVRPQRSPLVMKRSERRRESKTER